MVSIDNISERLEAIEDRLYHHGAEGVDVLLRQIESNTIGDAQLQDRLFNLQLQYLIGTGDFKGLAQAIDTQVPQSNESAIRVLLAKGVLSNVNRDYRQSLIHFLEAEAEVKALALPRLSNAIQINIGTVYAGLHHYEEGLHRYEQILQNAALLNDRSKAALLHNMGNLQYALGNCKQSIDNLQASLAISTEVDDAMVSKTQILLVRSLLKAGNYRNEPLPPRSSEDAMFPIYQLCKAQIHPEVATYIRSLEATMESARDKGDIQSQLDASLLMVEYYKGNDDFRNAFEWLQQNHTIASELKALQESSKLTEQEVRYVIEQKEAAIKTLRKEQSLQKEIVRRNQMLEVANEDLRQFAYVVSHDLKEPLRMIGSYSQLIEYSLQDKVPADEKEYFQYIKGGVHRLNELLDGLSNYSTLKALQEHHETQPLRSVVEAASQNLDVLLAETQAKVHMAGDVQVKGSPALLTLLFQNLIQNAIKFRREEVAPVIRIKCREIGDTLNIYVSDNGQGIPSDQYERIFVIFQRLHRNTAISGTGMGLAICKKIIQLHEGKISARANPDNEPGTTFLLELPN